jgi:hypothetical protein
MNNIDKLIDKVWSKTSDHPSKGYVAMSGKKTVRLGVPILGTGKDIEYELQGMGTLEVRMPNGKKIGVYSNAITLDNKKYPVSFRSLQKVIEEAAE